MQPSPFQHPVRVSKILSGEDLSPVSYTNEHPALEHLHTLARRDIYFSNLLCFPPLYSNANDILGEFNKYCPTDVTKYYLLNYTFDIFFLHIVKSFSLLCFKFDIVT